MRKSILILAAFLVLCGFKMFEDGGIIDTWYLDDNLDSTSGTTISISSASPPAVMIDTLASATEPFLVTPSANDTLVGPWGLNTPPATDNLVHRGSFETCAGSNPTGWWLHPEHGSGASDLVCDTAHKAKGTNSIKVTTTAVDGSVVIASNCMAIDDAKTYTFQTYYYGDATDENADFSVREYSDACSTLVNTKACFSGDMPANWSFQSCTLSGWDGSTAYIEIYFYITNLPSASTTVWVDDISAFEGSDVTDSSCTCDTDATCTCSAIIPSIATKATAGTWQFEASIRSPIDGADASPVRQIIHIPETGATNKDRVDLYWASDTLTLDVYDKDGTKITATISAPGAANTSYEIKAYHTDDGRIGVCWAGSCGTEATGAITITPNNTTYLGAFASDGGNIWVDDIVWSRHLTDPIGTP
jgi:hypothetical protein